MTYIEMFLGFAFLSSVIFICYISNKNTDLQDRLRLLESSDIIKRRILNSMSNELARYKSIVYLNNEEYRLMKEDLRLCEDTLYRASETLDQCAIEITNLKEALISCQEELDLKEQESEIRLEAITNLQTFVFNLQSELLESKNSKILCTKCQIQNEIGKRAVTFDGDTQ